MKPKSQMMQLLKRAELAHQYARLNADIPEIRESFERQAEQLTAEAHRAMEVTLPNTERYHATD